VPAVATHAAGQGQTGLQGSRALTWRIYRTSLAWTRVLHLKEILVNRTDANGQRDSEELDCSTDVTMKASARPFYVAAVNSAKKLSGVQPVKVAATAAEVPTARVPSEMQADATMRLTISKTTCAPGTQPPASCAGAHTLRGTISAVIWLTGYEAGETQSVLAFSTQPDTSGPPPFSRACIGAPGESTLATDAANTLFAGPGPAGAYERQIDAALPRLRMLAGKAFTTIFVKHTPHGDGGSETVTTIATFTPVKS
jgi:hypothetical protein